jgi:hypothetical protein
MGQIASIEYRLETSCSAAEPSCDGPLFHVEQGGIRNCCRQAESAFRLWRTNGELLIVYAYLLQVRPVVGMTPGVLLRSGSPRERNWPAALLPTRRLNQPTELTCAPTPTPNTGASAPSDTTESQSVAFNREEPKENRLSRATVQSVSGLRRRLTLSMSNSFAATTLPLSPMPRTLCELPV